VVDGEIEGERLSKVRITCAHTPNGDVFFFFLNSPNGDVYLSTPHTEPEIHIAGEKSFNPFERTRSIGFGRRVKRKETV